LIEPIRAETDTRELHSLIRAIVLGSVHRVVEENPTALAPFGLDKPVAAITIKGGSTQETLLIGDTGPLSSTLYVLRTSDHAVLLTDLAPKDFVNKSLMTFRRKDILPSCRRDRSSPVDLSDQSRPVSRQRQPKPKWKIRYPVEAE
jgi:hypothetical protein